MGRLWKSCNVFFDSRQSFFQHCRYWHEGIWCERCKRAFISPDDLDKHFKFSSAHHHCILCYDDPDFVSLDDLKDHYEQYHYYCPPCDIAFRAKDGLRQHDISEHFMCDECDRFFNNDNNLRMVRPLNRHA
jgi:hypothetical protein